MDVISANTESHSPSVAKLMAIADKSMIVQRQLDLAGFCLPFIDGINAIANPKQEIIITISCQEIILSSPCSETLLTLAMPSQPITLVGMRFKFRPFVNS